MRKVKYFIETEGIAAHKDGTPDLTGICLTVDLKKPVGETPYVELIKGLNPIQMLSELGILQDFWLEELKDARFITPEEFEAKYGEGEDAE